MPTRFQARHTARAFVLTLPLLAAPWAAANAMPSPAEISQAPDGAPNIVVILLDDVGFGATETFGGPVETPTLDELAGEGLRYNRFHTTAVCSPTRASLLTGRDSHAANVGAVMNSSNRYPGWQGLLGNETATIAEVLVQNGYNTAAFGKWHLTPVSEASPLGPFDRWPTGLGFEKFYGFLGGETDQYEPTLIDGTIPVRRPPGEDYHLTEDLAEQAVGWMKFQKSLTPDKPFFLYFAPGAAHAPLQVQREWVAPYKGKFAQGWDSLREETFARQKALGVIPEDAQLTPRHDALPAWDSLSTDEKRVAERLMETFAGFLTHTDVQVGHLVSGLKEMDQFDNTLFIYIVGDNGASSEGGLSGSVNYMGQLQGLPEPIEQKLARLDDIGGPDTFPHIPSPWAWATNAPFPWVKQVASHLGGTRNPMVVSWPQRIKDQGGLRNQYSHVNDITPTILEAVGLSMPQEVNGVAQLPIDGGSLLPSFDSAQAPEHKTTQLYEVHGHRSIYHDGWLASALHSTLPWNVGLPARKTDFEDDIWELYNLNEDFSQSRDLAQSMPEKLISMQGVFEREAQRMGILPLHNALVAIREAPLPSLRDERTSFTYHEGAMGIPEGSAPDIFNRSWQLRAQVEVTTPDTTPQGVIATMGGKVSGWSLFINDEGRPVFEYRVFEAGHFRIEGKTPLQDGLHQLTVDFAYDGDGWGKGGVFTVKVGDEQLGQERVAVTPPAFFSIDETFDIGLDTGSPAGRYPESAPTGYPFAGGKIVRVNIELQ